MSFHDVFSDAQPDLQYVDLDADDETIEGVGVDTLGYQGVAFFACVNKGEIASFDLKAQQDSDAAYGTAADLEGSKVTFATAVATNGFGFVDIKKPKERYVRPVLVVPNLTTPAAVAIISIRYGKNWLPETNADGELHVSPAEGTA